MSMRWASVALALAVLNLSLTFSNVWPTLAVQPNTRLSGELAVLVLALVLARGWRGSLSASTLRWLSVFWIALIIGRYVDVTVRSLYGREVNLYWDLRFVPDVSAMFAFVAKRWQAGAVALGLLLVPVLLSVPVRWALRRVSDATNDPRARRVLGLAAAAVLLLWIAPTLGARVPEAVRFADPVAPAYVRAVTELAYEMTGAGVRALGPAPPMDSSLSRVTNSDVFLVFIESYGAVSWARPELAQPLAASRGRLEADIRETGRSVVSALVESTTFGGESWLAHLSLLSGTEVRDQRTNVRLMAQDRDTLVKVFGRHGYRTVAIMPGLLRGWPQGAFYGFEEIYDLSRLDYRGPPFGWWNINDQFALARMDALEVERRPRRPVFVFFPTITTHAPFTPAPPYQKDWRRVLTANPYDQVDLDRAWSDQPDWSNLGPSYVQSLDYTHATLGGYLRLRADRDFVVILIGDHQPPALVSGADASWDVPVHVITGRTALLDRLRQHGFRDGLAPPHRAAARMHTLLPILLDAFGDPAPLRP
jgi:Sulfatase